MRVGKSESLTVGPIRKVGRIVESVSTMEEAQNHQAGLPSSRALNAAFIARCIDRDRAQRRLMSDRRLNSTRAALVLPLPGRRSSRDVWYKVILAGNRLCRVEESAPGGCVAARRTQLAEPTSRPAVQGEGVISR